MATTDKSNGLNAGRKWEKLHLIIYSPFDTLTSWKAVCQPIHPHPLMDPGPLSPAIPFEASGSSNDHSHN